MIDVLIIGSGGAGLSAALSAKEQGASVLVISKTFPTHSQTCQAQGGINAVLNSKEDSIQNFIQDTQKAAHGLTNKNNTKFFCEEASNTIKWLDDMGVPFSRNDKDAIAQRKFGGTKAVRTCYSSDYTGLKILHTLYDQCIKNDIKILNEYQLLNFIIKDKEAIGATFLDINKGEVKEFIARSIVLASGGYSSLYNGFTTNSYASTGDGIASAYRAGAKLSNMEFVQFHPTTLEYKNILISESARGEGGYLLDENKQRFIDELKPRDEVARAIYKKNELKQKVYLDLRHLGLEKINETMPQERRLALEFLNLKMEEDLIPITPSAHYCMGGVLCDEKTQTSIKNLFACGECSQSGIHGANRLGGNSLQEIITFGKLAGKEATKSASRNPLKEESNTKTYLEDKKAIEAIYELPNEINFYEKKNLLGKSNFKNIGLFRDEKNMLKSLEEIKEFKSNLHKMGIGDKSKIYNKNLVEFIEFKNSLELSEIIVKSALNRKESRGAHFRIDYPKEDRSYEKNSIALYKEENLCLDFEVIK